MKKPAVVCIVFGALMAVSVLALPACQSTESTEPMAFTGSTETEQAQPGGMEKSRSSGHDGHRNWGKMRR